MSTGRVVSASVRAVASKKRLIPQRKAIVLVCLSYLCITS